jgi:DNA-binding response OmpR family regulator
MMQITLAIDTLRAVAAGKPEQLAALRAIRSELNARQDRIDELSAAFGLKPVLPAPFNLTTFQADIFGALLATSGVLTSDRIETLLYGGMPEADRPRDVRATIKVHINHLRARLAKFSIQIETVSASLGACGYRLTPDMKAKARAKIAEFSKECA